MCLALCWKVAGSKTKSQPPQHFSSGVCEAGNKGVSTGYQHKLHTSSWKPPRSPHVSWVHSMLYSLELDQCQRTPSDGLIKVEGGFSFL